MRPTQSRSLLHGDARSYVRGNYAVAVLRSLLLKDFPGGHADHAHSASFRRELLISRDAQRYLAAGGHQNQLRLAIFGVCQHIRASGKACGGGIFRAVESRQRLARQNESYRLMLQLHDDSPRLSDFVGIGGPHYDESGYGAQGGKLLYRLMGRAVFTHADGIVGKDVDHRNFHDGSQPHGRARVVAEDQEP